MKEYIVMQTIIRSRSQTVKAKNEDEADEIACEKDNWDYDENGIEAEWETGNIEIV